MTDVRCCSRDGWLTCSYAFPNDPNFSFSEFYEKLNQRDLVIYPGKVTAADCFRIGSIGQLCVTRCLNSAH